MPEHVAAWEKQHGRIPARRVGAAAHRLEQAHRSRRSSSTCRPTVRTARDSTRRTSELLANDRDVLGVGVETVGTDAGQAGTFDPPFPNHTIDARRRQVRAGEPVQPRPAAGDRRGRDRGAAQDRERQRQPAARAGDRAGVAERGAGSKAPGSRPLESEWPAPAFSGDSPRRRYNSAFARTARTLSPAQQMHRRPSPDIP